LDSPEFSVPEEEDDEEEEPPWFMD